MTRPSTTTTVTSSKNPQTTGTSVTFTATVVPIPVRATGPTGTVSFFDGATLLFTQSLSSGSNVATYTTTSLAQGSHLIKATYSGNPVYTGSSGNLNQTITRRPTNIVASGGGGRDNGIRHAVH